MTPREVASAIWSAALAAGDPAPLLHAALRRRGSILTAGSLTLDLDGLDRMIVLGFGKAGGAMAAAIEAILGDRISEGFVVVKDGYTSPTRLVTLAEAGHPVPDDRGQAAATRLLELADTATRDDLVVVLVSGGGSALTPAPAPPVTLDEKQQLTRQLLAAGATINELNAVRKHLSRIKGGQLARAAAPARVVTLILSDVIGDPLDVIASGPTAPDPTTFEEALTVIERRGLTHVAPRSAIERLRAGVRGDVPETPKPADPIFERVTNLVIGNNALIGDAAVAAAGRLGYRPHFLTRQLQGEARDVARDLVDRARRLDPPACVIATGETTVTVRGSGKGGRCQEFALAAAIEIEGQKDFTVLAAGTDGTDGPTSAAGGVVDGETVSRGRTAALDANALLDDNDSYRFLQSTGDLLLSGPTNTNLLDLYVVLRG